MQTLLPFTLSILAALLWVMRMTREHFAQPFQESRRLLEPIGWAVILPQLLATMGILFTQAGVGKDMAYLFSEYLSLDHYLIAVTVFVLGMALLTILMGNAFAAFPIMVAAVGYPVLVKHFGGRPEVMAAICMFSGYCGTLLTPMAANFNLVPVALLNLPSKWTVIREQWPTAVALLAVNIVLLALFLRS